MIGTLSLEAHWVNWHWDSGHVRNPNSSRYGQRYTDVGFWPGAISVYSRHLGSVSQDINFPFYETMTLGLNAWSNALAVPITTTNSRQQAQLTSFGGEREYLIRFSGQLNIAENVAGFAEHPTRTPIQQLIIGNSTKTVFMHPGQSRLFNFEREVRNLTQLIKHEIGHSLGYWGHSDNINSVMWWQLRGNSSLQQGEIDHLRQVYNHFR